MSDVGLEHEAVRLAERVSSFFERTERTESARQVQRALGFSRHAAVTLVVAGERGTGKTSLLNSLLGDDLLLVGTWGTTDKCWVVRHRDDQQCVVSELVDGEGDDASSRMVEVRRPLLSRGLTLVDTPGIGGSAELGAISRRAAQEHADAMVFTLDAASSISPAVVEFLREVTDSIGMVIFVLTKIDSEPGWEQALDNHGRRLGMIVPATTRTRVLAVSSTWRRRSDQLRQRGEHAEAARVEQDCGLGHLEAEIEQLVTHRRWLRSRAVLHTCHQQLGESSGSADESEQSSTEVAAEVMRLRKARDRLVDFAQRQDVVLAGFREEMAALSREIERAVAGRHSQLERHRRGIDATSVSAQDRLGDVLNSFLVDVERQLDDLVREYQQFAARRVLEALRAEGFHLMAASSDTAMKRPDTAGSKIDPRVAPREVTMADTFLGAVRIAERALLGDSLQSGAPGSRPGVEVARRMAANALGRGLLAGASGGPIIAVTSIAVSALVMRAGHKEAARERTRLALHNMVDEAAYSLSGYPGVYQAEIDRYRKRMWKELRKVAAQLAEHTAETLDQAEKRLATDERLQQAKRATAELAQFTAEQLRNDVQQLLARFDREADRA